MKFIKELDGTFVLLILYIAKSVLLPGVIDLGVLVVLSTIFVLKYITNKLADTKLKIVQDNNQHDQFKFLEKRSEENFREKITAEVLELTSKVSSFKLGKDLRNGIKK